MMDSFDERQGDDMKRQASTTSDNLADFHLKLEMNDDSVHMMSE